MRPMATRPTPSSTAMSRGKVYLPPFDPPTGWWKVCEDCGALFVRHASSWVVCEDCAGKLRDAVSPDE